MLDPTRRFTLAVAAGADSPKLFILSFYLPLF
jgi:hypothetical protein